MGTFLAADYHSLVRHVLLYLLILILPIRGWAAEVMAVQMAQSELPAAVAMASGMPADCPMLVGLDATGDDQPDSQNQHAVCPSCQLCMGMTAVALPAPTTLAQLAPAGLVAHCAADFQSAELVRQQKPPIS